MGIHILLQYSNRQHLHQLFQTHHTNPNTTINNNTINMTDDSRKGLGDKVQDKVTPQESKSTTDKVKEGVTNTADMLSATSFRMIRSLPVRLPLTRPLAPPTPTRTTSP